MIPVDWAWDTYQLLALCAAMGGVVVLIIAYFYFDDDRCF